MTIPPLKISNIPLTALIAPGLLTVISALFLAAYTVQVKADADTFAVVFPPWWSHSDAIQAAASADAAVVRLTAIPSILVVSPASAGDMTRLRLAGAWIAVDPVTLEACLPQRKKV